MHDLDVLDRHAERRGDELREGGLVALAVAVGACEDGDRAGRVEAHLRRLPEADAGAERADHRRGGDAAGLDVGGEADAAQLALDRKRVVYGKSGSVRVDLGGRRIIKKKKKAI